MADLGSLYVKMSLESAQFLSGMKAAAAQSQATNQAITKAMDGAKTAVKGFLAVLSVDALVSATKAAFDYADSIVDIAAQTGATTKSVQELRYAAQMTGSDFESADGALAKFSKNLGDAERGSAGMQKVFQGLGVTSTDFDTALRQTIAGISQLPTVSQRSSAAMQIFGKSAGSLTVLLGEGTKGFDELAEEADKLGIVLGDELLQNAGQVNDRLDQLKMTLDAKFAGAVIQNADAMGNLADNILKIAGALIQFWAQNPTGAMAIMGGVSGALAGGMVAGVPGAIVGGAAGATAGAYLGYSSKSERKKLEDQIAETQSVLDKKSIFGGYAVGGPERKKREAQQRERRARLAAMDRQDAAAAALLKQKPGGGGTGTLPTPSHKPSGKSSGKSATETAAEQNERYQSDLVSGNLELLSAQQALLSDVIEQSQLEREILTIESNRRKAAIDRDVADKKLTEAQGEALKALEDKIVYEKYDLVNLRENEAIAKDKLGVARAGLSDQMDLLSSEQALARSSSERQKVALRLIDLQQQQEKLALDAVLASKTATEAEKEIAKARLAILPQLRGNAEAAAKRDNQGPLGQYLDTIPRTGDEIKDSLEGAATKGLDSLQDGLMNVVKGTGTVKDAFASMAGAIIDELIKISLQKAILEPLGALFGGLISSFGSSLFGGASAGGGDIVMGGAYTSYMGARANGGLTRAGRYLVGERGPEIVDIGNTASTTPHHALKGIMGRANLGPVITFGHITSNDPAAVKVMASQAIMEAMPLIIQQSKAATMTSLRRPTM